MSRAMVNIRLRKSHDVRRIRRTAVNNLISSRTYLVYDFIKRKQMDERPDKIITELWWRSP